MRWVKRWEHCPTDKSEIEVSHESPGTRVSHQCNNQKDVAVTKQRSSKYDLLWHCASVLVVDVNVTLESTINYDFLNDCDVYLNTISYFNG